tara:strand:+ start:35 stop:724 length:690 start_codon:yes stop_codon:yes gene_type:complete
MKLIFLIITLFIAQFAYPIQKIDPNELFKNSDKKLNKYINVYRTIEIDGSISEEKNGLDDLLKIDFSEVSRVFLLQYINVLKIMIDPENIDYKIQYIDELPNDYESLKFIDRQSNISHVLSEISLEFPKRMMPKLINFAKLYPEEYYSNVDTNIDGILIKLIVNETDTFLKYFNQLSYKQKYRIAYFVAVRFLDKEPRSQEMLLKIKNSRDEAAYNVFMQAQDKKDDYY